MKLPFPYVRWERADPIDAAAESRAHDATGRSVDGSGTRSEDFESVHLHRIERLAVALRDERGRIARHAVNDMVAFESIAAQVASAIEDCRRECAALIESRTPDGNKRRS